MERKVYFPSFSSFPIFFITLLTSIFLFIYILNDSGIVCVMLMLYLFLLSVHKIFDAGCLLFTIVCGICICEVRVLYSILPHIFVQLSNGLIFILCHVFLLHFGLFIFLEFGFDKLRKQDQIQLADLNLIIMITFPSAIAAIWTFATSLFIDLSFIPYVSLLLTFFCHQVAFRMYTSVDCDSTLSLRHEVPITISIVQLLSGNGAHIVILVSSIFHTSTLWSTVMMDQLMLFITGSLLITLLPTSRLLVSCGSISHGNLKLTSKISGLACYLLTIPVLYIHGIHFHMARLMFVKMCLLVCGLVYATGRRARLVPILLGTLLLLVIFLWELPWGMQLMSNTTLFLERIYLGIILISLLAIVALRSLAVATRAHINTSIGFQVSFLLLVSVFHWTESSLYFYHLVPALSVLITIIIVGMLNLSLLSERLSIITSALIDSQLVLKLIIVTSHWSTEGHRMFIGPSAYIGSLIFGFVTTWSLRSRSEPPFVVSLLKLSSVCLSLLLMRDSVLLYILYSVTNEQLLHQLSIVQCIVVSIVLDCITNYRRHNIYTIIRVTLALAATTLLISTTTPIGVLLLGIFIVQWWNDKEKWHLMAEVRNGILLSSGGILMMSSLVDVAILESVLVGSVITSLYVLHRLVSQASIRVLKRLFMRLWLLWQSLWLVTLLVMMTVCGQYYHGHYGVVVATPLILSWSLAISRHQSLQDKIDHDTLMISTIRTMSLIEAILGGLIIIRLQWSSPLASILPLCLLLLEKYPCNCHRNQLSSKHINSLSLAVSVSGIFLFFGTIQESSLFSSAVLQSAIDLSLQLDMVATIKSWFELLLSCLLAMGHLAMLVLSVLSVKPHHCATAKLVANVDLVVTLYTIVIPVSLGFLFCCSSLSSALLALLSFTSGLRFLITP